MSTPSLDLSNKSVQYTAASLLVLPTLVWFFKYSFHPRLTMTKRPDGKKSTIVVLGGGAAGIAIVKALSEKLDKNAYDIVMFTSRSHFVYLPATIRAIVVPSFPLDSLFMPYDKFLEMTHARSVVDPVVGIEKNEDGKGGHLVLGSGERLEYDALVLASGSIWGGPWGIPEDEEGRRRHVEEWRRKFKEANNIVVAGGGACGVELAGELKDEYPEKPVTIVHSQPYLMNATYPDSWRKDIEMRLRKRGINLILNDYVDGEPQPGQPFATRDGKKLDADLVAQSRGGHPNTSYLTTLIPSPLTPHGFVQIEPTLQVKGHPGIFAAGDILDWDEAKQYAKVRNHVPVVVESVGAWLEGGEGKKLYKKGAEMIVVTNGKNGGAAYLNGIQLGDFFSRMIKSKTLMVPDAKASLGLN